MVYPVRSSKPKFIFIREKLKEQKLNFACVAKFFSNQPKYAYPDIGLKFLLNITFWAKLNVMVFVCKVLSNNKMMS